MDRAHVDFLGLVALGSLAAFEQTAAASAAATGVADKLVLARIAAQRFTHVESLERRLREAGSGLTEAVRPFVAPVEGFNAHTTPLVWGEHLVKLCIMGGLAHDLADQVGPRLDPALAELLAGTIDDGALAGEPGRMLAALLDEQPELAGRLALFGRRLLGEALSQAQRVAAAQPDLTALLTGTADGGDDLAAVSQLMARLTSGHVARMEQLGL